MHSPLPNLPLSVMLTFLFICLSHPLTVPLCFAPALFLSLVFVLFLFIGLSVKVSLDKWGARERDILWHPIYLFGQKLQLICYSYICCLYTTLCSHQLPVDAAAVVFTQEKMSSNGIHR